MANSQHSKNIHIKDLLYDILHSSLLLFQVLTFISMMIFAVIILLAEQIVGSFYHIIEVNVFYLVLFGIAVSSFLFLNINEILQRCLLRLCLCWEGQLPMLLVPWLDAMQQRKVLQRAGGSYRFLHKQLQEYMAKQEENNQSI